MVYAKHKSTQCSTMNRALPAVDMRNLAKGRGYDHVGPQLHFTDA